MNNIICKVKIEDKDNPIPTKLFNDFDKVVEFIENTTKFLFPKDLLERGSLTALAACSEELSKMGIIVSFAIKEPRTDKEKLLRMLENYDDSLSFEEIILLFIDVFGKEFSAGRIHKLIKDLNDVLLEEIDLLERCKATAKERAIYLKSYLKGEMYTSKEVAEQHLDIQINHAQTIIDTCGGRDMAQILKESMKL